MSSPEARQFKETVLERIMGAYRDIDTERIYLLLSDISLGSPSPGIEHDEARFVVETLQLLKNEYSHLSPGDVQLTLGQLAQETDRARRMSGNAAPKKAAATPKRPEPRSVRSRSAKISTAYVRAPNWSYVRAWDPKNSLLGLQFESRADLESYAKELAREGGFRDELDPPPPELAALTIEVSAPDLDPVHFAGSAVGRDGNDILIDVPALPPALRKAAAKLRAQISSAHSSVSTPVVDPDALSRTAAADSSSASSVPSVSDVSESRPVPTIPERRRSSAEHRTIGRKRRAAARTNQSEAVDGSDTTESDFARIPTGGGRDSSIGAATNPGPGESSTSARRRRARAVARAHTHTGSTARVLEDELKRFGKRTGRRVRTRNHQTLPQKEGSLPRPSPDEFAGRSSSGAIDTQTIPVSNQTKTVPVSPAPAEPKRAPSVTKVDNKPPPAQATPTAPRPTPAPQAPARHMASGPVEALDLDANSSIEVGPLVARKDGANEPGGAAAVLLDAAAAYPGSIVTINTPNRTWKLAVREDVILHFVVSPDDPEFSVETAIRRSEMVDPADLAEAVDAAASSGQKLTDVLVRNRKILFRQLDAVLSARAQLMFQSLFREDITSFSAVGYESIDNRGSSPISAAPVAWQHLKKSCNDFNQDELDRLLSPHYADRPHFVKNAFLNALTLRLTTKETKFVNELLIGECTVSQGVAKSPLRRRQSLALVLALDRIGLIEWEKVETAATRVARVWSVIQTKLSELDGTHNPFEVLEAHWSADEKLIGDSFIALCRLLDLDYVQQNGTPNEQAAAARLRDGLLHTRTLLRDRKDRHKYRCEIVDEFNRRNAVHLYEKQAELALFKSDYASAEDSLRRVVEMAPTHPTAASQLRGVLAALASRES